MANKKKRLEPKERRQRILDELSRSPTATLEALADSVDCARGTVSKDLELLKGKGYIEEGRYIRKNRLPEHGEAGKLVRFLVFIATMPYDAGRDEYGNAQDYQEAICKTIQEKTRKQSVIFGEALILMGGDWDVLVSVYAEDSDDVSNFITKVIRGFDENGNQIVPGVTRTSTVWASLPGQRRLPVRSM